MWWIENNTVFIFLINFSHLTGEIKYAILTCKVAEEDRVNNPRRTDQSRALFDIPSPPKWGRWRLLTHRISREKKNIRSLPQENVMRVSKIAIISTPIIRRISDPSRPEIIERQRCSVPSVRGIVRVVALVKLKVVHLGGIMDSKMENCGKLGIDVLDKLSNQAWTLLHDACWTRAISIVKLA